MDAATRCCYRGKRVDPLIGAGLSHEEVRQVLTAFLAVAVMAGSRAPTVEVEEDVYSYTAADNGAGPMWTHGNTCIVRVGNELLASGIETLPGYKPLNNVRWMLFRRLSDGWKLESRGTGTHEREPCPMVAFPDGRIFLSVNPNASKPDEYDGAATPQVLEFSASSPKAPRRALIPKWDRPIAFHGHTYRSFAADAVSREFILFYNTAYDRAYWTWYDRDGRWAKQGALDFPWGAEYDKPQPIRICYPNVALRQRKAFFCGVSDIIEPYTKWRQYKKKLTGRDWDYDFRRLFFTWSDDIATGRFHDWVEIASRDRTCGWVFPCDLHVGADGHVHLLWAERALDERLRAKFFPDAKQSLALNYAVVVDGRIKLRRSILEWREGQPAGERPGNGRFHVLPDGRLLVVYYVSGQDACGKAVSENRLVEIRPDGTIGQAVRIPLRKPLPSFFTATPRAGCAPLPLLDLFGDVGGTMRYARIRVR